MKVEQIYTGCLAQGAYYIMSEGEVAIIDPLREVDAYIQRASIDKAQIKYVLETHFHADFVSGHLDLAKKTGAKIVYGPTAAPAFEFYSAKDGEELSLGKSTYWSSTEYDSNNAWSQSFYTGYQDYIFYKSFILNVRAVRSL
jgi:glyoxylase-like metal-dependent hydrolase (beta-lactamase superfamily II)